ncbi:MAG: hypothetical protein SFV54_10145 [Bryobacteraceae bacterium]|nr:hypothetical protein [Bryobacteraceae bacterium]
MGTDGRRHGEVVAAQRLPRLAATAILLYFLVYAGQGVLGGFNQDDLMNMYRGFMRSWSELLFDHVAIWKFSPTYRPFGALFYKAVYEVFGFTPAPFRVVCMAALLVNLALLYRFAETVAGSRFTGTLAALLLTFHGGMFWLYYGSGLCYDVFCFTWYFAALVLYVRVRGKGRLPGAGATLLWTLFYVLALNSKEMAVSLPVVTLGYELLFHPPAKWTPAAVVRWMGNEGRTALLGGALTAVYIFGRVLSPEVVGNAAYAPVLTLARFLENGRHYWGEFFFRPAGTLPAWMAVLATVAVVAGTIVGSRAARLGALLFFVAPLPMIFIVPRGLDGMYIPLAGLALMLAAGAATVGQRLRLRPVAVFVAVLALVAGVQWGRRVRHEPHRQEGDYLWEVYRQINGNFPVVGPKTRILWVRDPFPEYGWGSHFLTRLAYGERDIEVVRIDKVMPAPTPARLAEFDLYWWYEKGRLTAIPTGRVRRECLAQPDGCGPGEPLE